MFEVYGGRVVDHCKQQRGAANKKQARSSGLHDHLQHRQTYRRASIQLHLLIILIQRVLVFENAGSAFPSGIRTHTAFILFRLWLTCLSRHHKKAMRRQAALPVLW